MTELVVVSKPRSKFYRWIGGTGTYQAFLSQQSFTTQGSAPSISIYSSSYTYEKLYSGGYTKCAQQFTTPSFNVYLQKVEIRLAKLGSPPSTDTVYVYLYSNSNDRPGSQLATLGSISVASISSERYYTFQPSTPISLNSNTKYWISVEYSGGNSSNCILMMYCNSDVYPNNLSAAYIGSWYTTTLDYIMNIYFLYKSFSSTFTVNLDFQYMGLGVKRLEDTGTRLNLNVTNITVNGVSVGNTLEKTDEIPQSNNYQIVYYFTVNDGAPNYELTARIQRYLYYYSPVISLENLGVSEAYVARIKFMQTPSTIQFDDNPDSRISGSANEIITFSPEIPFRKIEWLEGGGEVWIIGVE